MFTCMNVMYVMLYVVVVNYIFLQSKLNQKIQVGTTVSSQNLETYIYLYPVFYIFKKIYYLYVPMVYCCTFSTNVEGTLQLEECL